ncbi:hypothetical protein RRG08_027036 [Elysia crispata]|uniref:Uncharacterized protein n=1 Tax=Elysia crispata TaxID=231223 RepID=A0AAE0ZIN9_9GAST|nr:hypothetical protein RRG08_027036 [Elysia crispata]
MGLVPRPIQRRSERRQIYGEPNLSDFLIPILIQLSLVDLAVRQMLLSRLTAGEYQDSGARWISPARRPRSPEEKDSSFYMSVPSFSKVKAVS